MDGVLKIGIQNEKIAAYSLLVVLMAAVSSGGYMFLNLPSFANQTVIANLTIDNYEKEHSDALFSYAKKEVKKETVSLSKVLQLKYKSAKVTHVAKGIDHIQFKKIINSKPIKVNVLEINRDLNPDIKLAPVLAGSTPHSKATISRIANKSHAVAAINGTYFKPNTGTPLGMLVIDNKVISGPVYNRVAMGIGDNDFVMSRTDIQGKIITKEKNIRINNVNQPRMLSSDVLIYTSDWGRMSPAVKAGHRAIKVINGVVVEISDLNPVSISSNSVIIDAPKTTVSNINLGDKLAYEFSVNEKLKGYENVISGGPYLVKNGNVFVDVNEQKLTAIGGRNPRTAIGYTEDKRLIMVTIDGREETSVGITLTDLAILMKSLGCVNAMNLDGGGSTVMYVNGKVVNSPAVKGGIQISNALTVSINEKIAQK
ncbi:phosphodiester glycosidase family protein [bacterium]|nr:phosphodiester glycosidase family protein [bacterium]